MDVKFIILEYKYNLNSDLKKEESCTVYFNGKDGIFTADEAESFPLSTLDKILLEKKPLVVNLPFGSYKLIADFGKVYFGSASETVSYERIENDKSDFLNK
jgi:hypothetical protein